MYSTFFLFNFNKLTLLDKDIQYKKKKAINSMENENEELIIDNIIQKKPIEKQKKTFIKTYNKIDYSDININYFMDRAIKKKKVKKITINDFNLFSLLQREILYNDFLIKKFVNFLIRDGKKFLAYKTFERAIFFLKKKIHRHPLFFLRYFLYVSEQFFDYKAIRSKKTNQVLFIIPKCVEGKARWLKPLNIWVSEFFNDQTILYKFFFFRKFYLRVAFTLFRICKTHSFFVKRIVTHKHSVVTKHHKRIDTDNIFGNKKIKRLKAYLKRDKDTKWNWIKGRNWKEYNRISFLKPDHYDLWNSKLFDDKEVNEFIRGAVKTNPRKLKKKHVLSSFTWFR